MRPIKFIMLFLLIAFQTKAQIKQITVAQDGSGDFKTIQQAVLSIRDHSQLKITILVKEGVYKEKLVIPAWKKNISIIGEDKERTIISHNDYSGKDFPMKDFTGNSKYNTYTSYTVLIQGNDCSLENLTIENTAGRIGQAVALSVEADRFKAKNCIIKGNQDTLYTSKDGRNYFESCYIEGTTDFIFGEATVVFQSCTIKSLSNSFITAASTTAAQKFGYVFFDCNLIAEEDVDKVYLGRPWRPYAKTVFIRSALGKHIIPVGWDAWTGDPLFANKDKTAYYAEYQNTGPGADVSKRVKWSKQLKKVEFRQYTLKNIFNGWNPLI